MLAPCLIEFQPTPDPACARPIAPLLRVASRNHVLQCEEENRSKRAQTSLAISREATAQRRTFVHHRSLVSLLDSPVFAEG